MITLVKKQHSVLSSFHVRNNTVVPEGRIVSVDALRGFDMFWIIGGYWIFTGLDNVFHNKTTQFIKVQLDHAEWVGFNFYDIIMPLFLFLVGVSMVFSYKRRLSSANSNQALWKHTLRRVAILWILGMIVQGKLLSYDINQLQLYSNTLQAIASGYLVVTIIILSLKVPYQIVATMFLMLLYWAIVALIPIGGTTANAYSMTGNVPLYFDHLVLGRFHDGLEYTWIISSLNFGATTMIGVFCGYILQSRQSSMKKFWSLVFLGLFLVLFGVIWSHWHPIIKKIWTSSFVLFSGGISALMLALFYLVIDVAKFKSGTKWMIIIGSNAIFAYVAWHLFDRSFTSIAAVFVDGLKPYIGQWYDSLLYFGGFMVLFLLLKYMYKRKIFIKI